MTLNLDKGTWKRVALGDVADASKDRCDPTDGSIQRYVAGEHMDTDDLKIHRWGEIGDGYLGPAFHRRFHPGQVLYGSRRTYLRKVAVADFGGVCSNTTFVVDTKDPNLLLQEFLPFVMTAETFHAFAIKESKGSVNPYVNWSDIAHYEFDLPPLDQQQRIAHLLWALEGHRLALTLCCDAFTKSTTELRRDVLGGRPWDGYLGEALRGITAGRSLVASSAPATADTFGVLKVSAVGSNGFVGSENKELLDQSIFLPQFTICKDDLLITRANTAAYVGRPVIVDADYPNLMLSDKTLRLEVDTDVTSAQFLREYLLTPRTRAAMAEVATGTGAAMKNISQADVRALPMPRFSPHEQKAFLRTMTRVSDSLNRITEEREALATLRSALLSDVFRGN